MNRFLAFAIVINVIMLGIFVWADAFTWTIMGYDLHSQVYTIITKYPLTYDFWTHYTGLQAGIGFGYFTGPVGNYFFTGSDSVNEINFPLIGFVVTVIINLFLILYSETQRRKPQVKLKEESERAN